MKSFLCRVALTCAVAFALVLSACGISFAIEGKWRNVGSDTYGQVQSGSIVVFDGENCNMVSPYDTYALTKSGNGYRLDCTTLLFSQTLSFDVRVIDNCVCEQAWRKA